MHIDITQEPPTAAALARYATIPIAFEVRSIYDVVVDDNGQIALNEQRVDAPYIKDYDGLAGEGPARWAEQFDLSNWVVLVAHVDGKRAGGAVVAHDTPGVNMLEGRNDLAVLWDIRVSPELRSAGVGRALFAAAEKWAIARGCRQLKIETQNINTTACRFYRRQGCRLAGVDRKAYPELPEEIQLLWYMDLG
jgi:GNAT superfamily N-acetyltransferase